MTVEIADLKRGRRGFTLAEVLIASAIGAMVLAATVTVFVASQRGLQAAMAQIQTAVELRMLREKLLFRIDGSGGLMSARYSTIEVEGGAGGWGSNLSFVPFEGDEENAVSWDGGTKKLSATEALSAGWLSSGQIVLDDGAPFRASIADGEIHVDANASLRVGARVYGQRQLIRAQIMAQ